MEERIRKWQEEIERITIRQKEMNQSYNEKIRELKRKIEEAREQIKMEQDQQIARMVRGAYGQITPEALEELKVLLEMAGQGDGGL